MSGQRPPSAREVAAQREAEEAARAAAARRRADRERFLRRSHLVVDASLFVIGAGIATLIINAWVEYLTRPGLSIIDGYWVGRVPWTPLGVLLVLIGSAGTIIAGAAATMVAGGWLRRALLLAVFPLPVLWWSAALGYTPLPRFHGPDPVGLAFSAPQGVALALLLPAIAAAALALSPRMRPEPTSHMAPVHDLRARSAGRSDRPGSQDPDLPGSTGRRPD
jgi:hypothetical protein